MASESLPIADILTLITEHCRNLPDLQQATSVMLTVRTAQGWEDADGAWLKQLQALVQALGEAPQEGEAPPGEAGAVPEDYA